MLYEIFAGTKYEKHYRALRRAFKAGCLATLAVVIQELTRWQPQTETTIVMLALLMGLDKFLQERITDGLDDLRVV